MKVYIVSTVTTNEMEPSHHMSSRDEKLEGIYASHESALARVDELHEKYRAFESENPEWYYIDQYCTITEHKLIT